MPTDEEFIGLLREALGHLYDSDRLRQSPLARLFGVADQPDTAEALRRILIDAVESLRPPEESPSRSRDWRLYEALFYQYVQQLDQRIVADQLALSVRHLRREQRAALEVLSDRLSGRVDACADAYADSRKDRLVGVGDLTAQDGPAPGMESRDLAWLRDLPSDRPTDFEEALSEVWEVLGPLGARNGVRVEAAPAGRLPGLAVHPIALNQILVSILSVAISRTRGGRVLVSAKPVQWHVEVQVEATGVAQEVGPLSEDEAASLGVARHLARMCGGQLTQAVEEMGGFRATLALPVLGQTVVLAVDDNADTLQLLDRYAAGTRFRIVGTRDPKNVVDLAETLKPQVILLDVMMPEVDGWRVLSRLREHPATGHIPVIVCTILAQEKLALALGASGFVAKPVTREALLDALNGQGEQPSAEKAPR